jgi:hypothetical protein
VQSSLRHLWRWIAYGPSIDATRKMTKTASGKLVVPCFDGYAEIEQRREDDRKRVFVDPTPSSQDGNAMEM